MIQAMMRGLEQVSPGSQLFIYPMASGGSGTTDVAVRLAKGRVYRETIPVPGHRPREVKWALLPDGTAIFDAIDAMGSPDGPARLTRTYTNSQPLGEMLQRLSSKNVQRIAVALGDVLAADSGMGLLQVFGVTARDEAGRALSTGPRPLLHVDQVDFSGLTLPRVPLIGLCDQMVSWSERVQQEDFRLDLIHGGLAAASGRYADSLSEHIRVPLADLSTTGAGGGIGMALAFMGAQFQPGATFLAELGSLQEKLWDVDWVITGSSTLDAQSDLFKTGGGRRNSLGRSSRWPIH